MGDESHHRAPYPAFELTPLSLGDDAELELAMHLSELGYDYQILQVSSISRLVGDGAMPDHGTEIATQSCGDVEHANYT
jgi:hypothetical protein